jgi:hypothetical protein
VPVDVVAPSAPSSQLEILQARYEPLGGEIRDLQADVRKGYSTAITEVLREKEQQQATVKEDLQRAQAEELNPIRDT